MALKLEKTLLSQKLTQKSWLMAWLSLLFLVLTFLLPLDVLSASGQQVFTEQQYWRLFTSPLMHADLNHLAHNAFFFTGLGFLLHAYFGPLVFPLISLLAGGPITYLTLTFYPPQTQLVGVSGVVYFMAAFWLTSFILIERRRSVIRRLVYAIGMSLIFFFPETLKPQVSYLAHTAGFLLGIPAAAGYFLLNRQWIREQEVWIEQVPDPDFEFDQEEVAAEAQGE